ncbi:MAG: metallophosphoesterase family protein [Mogibacterium sp.]|nr:metallophosphoesterase family protein [Mogibacterium sp.]
MQYNLTTIIVLAVYAIIQLYMFGRVVHYTNKIFSSKFFVVLAFLIYVGLSAMPVLGLYLKDATWKHFCMKYGNIWIGVVAVMFIVIAVIHLFTEIINVDDDLPRAAALIIFVIALAAGIGINVYGQIQARDVKTTTYTVDVSEGEASDKTLRIAFISDLHLGVNSKVSQVQDVVEIINANDVDVVIIGGDIFDGSYDGIKYPDRYIEEFNKIQSRYGVYGVYGTHDVESETFAGILVTAQENSYRSDAMKAFTAEAGWTMLEDAQVKLPNGVILVGRLPNGRTGSGMAIRKSAAKVLNLVGKKDAVVVVEFEPYGISELGTEGADLVLSGQTHAGQFFPMTLVEQKLSDNWYGLKDFDGTTSIVTSGVGTMGPPVRIKTSSEVVIIDVQF